MLALLRIVDSPPFSTEPGTFEKQDQVSDRPFGIEEKIARCDVTAREEAKRPHQDNQG